MLNQFNQPQESNKKAQKRKSEQPHHEKESYSRAKSSTAIDLSEDHVANIIYKQHLETVMNETVYNPVEEAMKGLMRGFTPPQNTYFLSLLSKEKFCQSLRHQFMSSAIPLIIEKTPALSSAVAEERTIYSDKDSNSEAETAMEDDVSHAATSLLNLTTPSKKSESSSSVSSQSISDNESSASVFSQAMSDNESSASGLSQAVPKKREWKSKKTVSGVRTLSRAELEKEINRLKTLADKRSTSGKTTVEKRVRGVQDDLRKALEIDFVINSAKVNKASQSSSNSDIHDLPDDTALYLLGKFWLQLAVYEGQEAWERFFLNISNAPTSLKGENELGEKSFSIFAMAVKQKNTNFLQAVIDRSPNNNHWLTQKDERYAMRGLYQEKQDPSGKKVIALHPDYVEEINSLKKYGAEKYQAAKAKLSAASHMSSSSSSASLDIQATAPRVQMTPQLQAYQNAGKVQASALSTPVSFVSSQDTSSALSNTK